MKLTMICASRGRPSAAAELADLWPRVTDSAALRVVADADDPDAGKYRDAVPGVMVLPPQPQRGLGPVLNAAAMLEAPHCDAVGFLGDDHRPRTPGWDTAITAALTVPGVAYGNDLHQGGKLPTAVVITSGIVQALGYMCPPGLTHMYLDDFWRRLGTDLGCLRYLPDVVIEHCHPHAGKAAWDEGYARVNDPAVYDHDREELARFLAGQWPADLARARAALSVAAP